MSYPKVYWDIFENEGAGPLFRSDRIPPIKAAGIADGAVTPEKLSQSYLPTTGGAITGAGVKIQFDTGDIFVNRSDTFDELMLRSLRGAGLYLRTGNSASLPGSFALFAEGSAGTKYLDGSASGELKWDQKPIIFVVESWRDGSNWYRKYSDGWIEQGGLLEWSVASSVTCTFFKAFSTICLSAWCITENAASGAEGNDYVSSITTSSCIFRKEAGRLYWRALGY